MPDFLAQSCITDRGKATAAVARAHRFRSPLLFRASLVPGDEIIFTFWRGSDSDEVGTRDARGRARPLTGWFRPKN